MSDTFEGNPLSVPPEPQNQGSLEQTNNPELRSPYKIKFGEVIEYETQDEGERERSVIMDVGKPGSVLYTVGRLRGNGLNVNGLSSHEVHKPTKHHGVWTMEDMEAAVDEYYSGNDWKDSGLMGGLKGNFILSEEKIEKLRQMEITRAKEYLKKMASRPAEELEREVTMEEILKSSQEDEGKKLRASRGEKPATE